MLVLKSSNLPSVIRDGLHRIKERLERALVNLAWTNTFLKTQVINEPSIGSDHSFIMIDTDWVDLQGTRFFKFEHMWTTFD